jgi:hypothetical protein
MSDRMVIDLADATDSPVAAPTRKRKLPVPLVAREVWQVTHQLEPQAGGIGSRGITKKMKHKVTVLSKHATREEANRAATICYKRLVEANRDESFGSDADGEDITNFVGKGGFKDGAYSGVEDTWSQRVHVVKDRV